MGNAMQSSRKRPLSKIGVMVGKRAVNAAASVSNGCFLRIPDQDSVLMFACVKFRRRRVIINGRVGVGLGVRRVSANLGRIMMINCNSRGHTSVMNSVAAVRPRMLDRKAAHTLDGGLTKGITNMVTIRQSKRPKTSNSGF